MQVDRRSVGRGVNAINGREQVHGARERPAKIYSEVGANFKGRVGMCWSHCHWFATASGGVLPGPTCHVVGSDYTSMTTASNFE